MINVHGTSIVETSCIGDNVSIGPFCYVGKNVILEEGVKLIGHCSIGSPPQMKNEEGSAVGKIKIGSHTEIREFVTINMPVKQITSIGKRCYIMAQAHIGHDCQIRNDVILGVGSVLGGWSVVDDFAYIGLNAILHQYSNVGAHCMIGANAFFKGESPVGITWAGVPAKPIRLNTIGMIRNIRDLQKIEEIGSEAMSFVEKKWKGFNRL